MSEPARILVLITGTGRSGTSTMSGTFHHLGLHVPGPHLGANESNPKGFFESKFAVRFHKELLERAAVHEMDSRPTAFAHVEAVVTADHLKRLEGFLSRVGDGHDQIVVKDPRSVWVQSLWRDAARATGLDIRYVSMLRHPAETIGSRATYYASDEAAKRRRYEIFNISRWINNQLLSERQTRGLPRSFVRYTDLLEDWRPVAIRLATELGLRYDSDLAPGTHHPVDDFIEPDLRRVRVTWDDLDIPPALQDLAQEVWDALGRIHDSAGDAPEASADLDRLAERYETLFAEASAISHDAAEGRIAVARRERAEPAPAPVVKDRPTSADRPVGEVGGRELLRMAFGRLLRRGAKHQGGTD